MNDVMSYTPFIWSLLISAGLLGGIAFYLRRYRDMPPARPFGWLMLLGMVWTLLYALTVSTYPLDMQILLSHLLFTVVVLVPNMILVVALEYVGLGYWLTRRRWLVLLSIPAVAVLLEWTAPESTLFHLNYYLDLSGVVPVLRMDHGEWFWVYTAYNAGMIITACGLMLGAFHDRMLHFGNSLLMVVAFLLPVMVDTLYDMGITPLSGYNFAPNTLILSSILVVLALRRFGLFDVAPVARSVLINTIDDLMIVLDTRGHIVDFNLAAQTRCGFTKALVGKLPEEVGQPWAGVLQCCGERSVQHEEISVVAGTRKCIFELTAADLKDARGRVLGRLFLLHDVTLLKQSQDRLQQLSQAVEQSPAAIVLTDLDGKIEYTNPKFTEITGYLPQEALGQNPRLLNSGLTSPQTIDAMWQAITAGREWVGEFINRKKNGDIFYESARISAITNPDGKITHYLAVKEDITERKRAEEELRMAHDRLQAHLEEIQTLQANLREQAMRDPLTGLYNRRYLQEALERELVRALREEYSVSVVMIDMDNLKQVNDTCGHDVGDLALQSLAAVLAERTRASDILCRMGGDEFLLVMPGLSAEGSFHWAERLRAQLFAIELPAALTRAKLRVTLSMGIAIFPEHGATSHQVILAADQAAYQAKALGRDRAIIYQLPEQV